MPGGSSLNTCRAVQFLLKIPQLCTYIGSVGSDQLGVQLSSLISECEITPLLHFDENERTGRCAVLINKKERTLVANLGACLNFPTSHF